METETKTEEKRYYQGIGELSGITRLPNGGIQVLININPLDKPDKPKDQAEVKLWEEQCADIDAFNYGMLRGIRFDRVELIQMII
jgi:hypothetical protein